MSTETDREALALYPFDGSDPNLIIALHTAFRAGAEFAAGHAPAPVPAPSVVPEAAVTLRAVIDEALADALGNTFSPSVMDDLTQRVHANVAAALPLLTAAPSVTREATEDEVTEVVTEALTDAYRAERGMSRHTGLTAHDESVIRDQAAHVVSLADARFTITPKEDR